MGLHLLLCNLQHIPNQPLHMLKLPAKQFKSASYHQIQSQYCFQDGEMAIRFLATILQNNIREAKHLLVNEATPPYSAVRTQSLQSSPYFSPSASTISTSASTSCYSIQTRRPGQETGAKEFQKCLITAVLLSAVTKRHIHTVTLYLSLCNNRNTLLQQLPPELQGEVVDQYQYLNIGTPYHDDRKACPVNSNIHIRKVFLQTTARDSMGSEEFHQLQIAVITAYKAHNVCLAAADQGSPTKSNDKSNNTPA